MVMATSSGRPQPNSRLRSRIGTSPWQIRLPSSRRDDAALDGVVLVLDVADDLLDDVLERDDAAQRAVLVDDDGEMLVAGAEGLELVEQDRRFGDEPGRRHDVVDLDRFGGPPAALTARNRSLAWTTPTMLSGSPR